MTRDEIDLGGPRRGRPDRVLLRGVLQRQADAVRPSGDGLARIQTEMARQGARDARRRGRADVVHADAGRRGRPGLVAAGGTAAVRALHRPPRPPAGRLDHGAQSPSPT